MTQAEYLEAEFRRYFPDATITVDTDEPEMLHVHVVRPIHGEPNRFSMTSFVMEIGSDDDWYEFSGNNDPHGVIITIPLMPDDLMP